MAIDNQEEEIAAFKDRRTEDFLKKHGLTYEDVRRDKPNTSGYQLHIGEYAPDEFELVLFKIVDTDCWRVKRSINIESDQIDAKDTPNSRSTKDE